MQYRNLLILLFVAALGLVAPAALAAPTFQPEVLLMRSVRDGAEKSFDHAKLKPVTPSGRDASAAFRYRAEADTVTCTVRTAPPNANGAIVTTVTLQRESLDPAGNKNITTTTQEFVFTPGKSLIVATAPHAQRSQRDTSVELLQLTLLK